MAAVLGRGGDVTRECLVELGLKADMGRGEASRVIERVEDGVSKWPVFAREYGVGGDSTREIARSLDEVRL